jgi:hypothetical protein
MTEQGLTAARVAYRMNLEAEAEISDIHVRDWRRGKSRPRLNMLPALSRAVGKEPWFFGAVLGAVSGPDEQPPKFIEVVRENLRLLADNKALQGRRSPESGVTAVVEAAIKSGWAVAVWPAVEGPADNGVRVAYRLRLHPVPAGAKTPRPEAADFKNVDSALAAAGAIRLGAWAGTYWPPPDKRNVKADQTWSILRLGSQHPPAASQLASPRSIGFVSLSKRAWPADVAALVARALGYGLTSSRDLARLGHEDEGDTATKTARRDIAFQQLLRYPPDGYVWYHFGEPRQGRPDPFVALGESWKDRTHLLVYLREDIKLLHFATRFRSDVIEGAQTSQSAFDRIRAVQRGRDAFVRDRLLDADGAFLKIAVGLPKADVKKEEPRTLRDAFTTRSLELAEFVIKTMKAHNLCDHTSFDEWEEGELKTWAQGRTSSPSSSSRR